MGSEYSTNARGLTHKGMVRKSNQDAFSSDSDQRTFVVADGMGGHAGGEVASNLSIEIIRDDLTQILKNNQESPLTNPEMFRLLSDSLNHASTKVYEKALEEPNLKGMGTTVTMLQILGQNGYYAHVGDSRLYLLRCGYIYQLTSDHSLVSEQVEAGLLTEEEAEMHQLRNVITRSIGYQETEYVDTDFFPVRKDDFLLLCSDGLHGKVSDQEICSQVYQHGVDAVDPLVDLANERGGEDNITVVIVKAREKRS